VICAGIYLALLDRLAIAVTGAASGILLESLGYLFLRRAELANQRMDTYHRELVQTYWLELLLVAAEQLPAARQVTCIESVIGIAAHGWFTPPGNLPSAATDQPSA
jgi:hypothetical protein